MAEGELDTRFEEAWLKFLESVKKIFGSLPDDRGLDQFLEFRDKVLEMVKNPLFLQEFNQSFRLLLQPVDVNAIETSLDLGEALILELKGFSKGVEV